MFLPVSHPENFAKSDVFYGLRIFYNDKLRFVGYWFGLNLLLLLLELNGCVRTRSKLSTKDLKKMETYREKKESSRFETSWKTWSRALRKKSDFETPLINKTKRTFRIFGPPRLQSEKWIGIYSFQEPNRRITRSISTFMVELKAVNSEECG